MDDLAYAAISLAAPTLLLSFNCGLRKAYLTGSVFEGDICAARVALSWNVFSMSANILNHKFFDKSRYTQNEIDAQFITLLLFFLANACTYLALTNNPYYAAPAAISMAALCRPSFCDVIIRLDSFRNGPERA